MYFKTLLFVWIVGLSACNNDKKESPPPEEKKPEIAQINNESFFNPDTSIAGIKIRDAESATATMGDKSKIDKYNQYHFYSKKAGEILSLAQHPGDSKNSISIFAVKYSDKAYHRYERLEMESFETEKGIRLGMNKQQITDRLGHEYIAKDSSKNYIELYYRVEDPKDTRTGLLKRHNMPIYYASYKLWDNKLGKFEFGFEYP